MTFEQLFESITPPADFKRNPRLKMDLYDQVKVIDAIKNASYEPQKNRAMAGKVGTVIARYPYSQSLKIGVDFGDGVEYKFNSSYLLNVSASGETAENKADSIIQQLVAKNPSIVQLYDEQKHAHLVEISKQLLGHTTLVGYAKSGITILPTAVITLPPNLLFCVAKKSVNLESLKMYEQIGIYISTAATIDDAIVLETRQNGAQFIIGKSVNPEARHVRLILPIDFHSGFISHASTFSPIEFLNVHLNDYSSKEPPIYDALFVQMFDNIYFGNANTAAIKQLFSPVMMDGATAAWYEYNKTSIQKYVAGVKTFITNAQNLAYTFKEKHSGLKVLPKSNVVLNFNENGQLQSTATDPSIIVKAPDIEARTGTAAPQEREMLIWTDGNKTSNRNPFAMFVYGDNIVNVCNYNDS